MASLVRLGTGKALKQGGEKGRVVAHRANMVMMRCNLAEDNVSF
jgi:hypothetical protein